MEQAIADICTPQGAKAGCGLCVFPRGLVITCAHVVADALAMDRNNVEAPSKRVDVRFAASGKLAQAEVIAWSAMSESDIAVLKVPEGAIAEPAGPARLFSLLEVRGSRFRAFGFPKGYANGRWGYGELLDNMPGGQVQVRSSDLAPGFSGGPVQELQMGRVVALLAQYDAQAGTGFAITAAQIARVCPDVEISRVESRFSPISDGLMGLPGDPLTGLEMFFSEYLGTPTDPRAFGGRGPQIEELENWFAHRDCHTAMISAPAGRGKSALVTRWASDLAARGRADVVFVPISIRFNTAQKIRVATLLGARLRYLADRTLRGTVHSSDPDQWMAEIGQRLREDRPVEAPKLLVILDGLDEATDWKAGEQLLLPATLGTGVKVLAAARTLAQDHDSNAWIERLAWPENTVSIQLPPLDSEGVADVLRSMGDPLRSIASRIDMVSELTRLSEGDPLLVSLYVEALRGSVKSDPFVLPEQLRAISPGPDGYFEAWWQDQRRQWGSTSPLREIGVLAILNVLCMALGPLKRADILELTATEVSSWSLDEALTPLSRFVIGDGMELGYVFTHPRLAQYFQSKMRSDERKQWNNRFREYGVRVVEALGAGVLLPNDVPRYIIQNFTAHLRLSKATAESYYPLMSEKWLRSWESQDGSFTGFLQDVMAAWEAADQSRNVKWQLFCCLIHSSLVGLRRAAPPALLHQGLVQGLFTESQVLAIMNSSNMDQGGQAELIKLIAPVVKARTREALLVKAIDFEEVPRVDAICGLLPNLPEMRLPAVIDLTEALSTDKLRHALLSSVSEAVRALHRDDLVEQVAMAAEGIQNEDLRADALRQLASALSPALAARLLDYVKRMRKPSACGQILTMIAPLLPPELMDTAVQLATKIWYPYRKAMAICAVINHCTPEYRAKLCAQALDAARSVYEADRRAECLVRVSSFMSPAERESLLAEALAIIDTEVGGNKRVQFLIDFPVDLTPDLAMAFRRAATKWTDELQKVMLLTRLAARPGAADRKELLEQALGITRSMNGGEVSQAFEYIAQSMEPAMHSAVIAQANEIPTASYRYEALVRISADLPEGPQEQLLEEVLPQAKSYYNDPLTLPVQAFQGFCHLLAEVSADLSRRSNGLVRGVVAQAEPDKHFIFYDRGIWQVWLRLLAAISARCASGFPLAEMEGLLKKLVDQPELYGPISALNTIAPFLQSGQLMKAIAIARRIGDHASCRALVGEVVAFFPAKPHAASQTEVIRVWKEIVSVFRGTEFSRLLGRALATSKDDWIPQAAEILESIGPEDQIEMLWGLSQPLDGASTTQLFEKCFASIVRQTTGPVAFPGLQALQAFIPQAMLPNCFAVVVGRDDNRNLDLLVSLACRMSEADRHHALGEVSIRLGRIENPVNREEILVRNKGVLSSLPVDELRGLVDVVGSSSGAGLLAKLFGSLSRDIQTALLPELLSSAEGPETVELYGIRSGIALRVDAETKARWLREAIELPSWYGYLAPISTMVKGLDLAEQHQFVDATIARYNDRNFFWDDDFGALVELADERQRSAFVAMIGSSPYLSSVDLGRIAPLLDAPQAAEVLDRLPGNLMDFAFAPILQSLCPRLAESTAPKAIGVAMKIGRDEERIRCMVAATAQLSFFSFLETVKASRMPTDTWGWADRGLHHYLAILKASRLTSTKFRDAADFSRALRELGDLERPECVAILSCLVSGILEYGGAVALLDLVHATVEVSRWWP